MRTGFSVTLALSTVLAVCSAPAVAQSNSASFEIPSGDMREALSLFSKQAGGEVFYREKDVEGKRSPGVRGVMSALSALRALLGDTGLVVRRDESGAMVVVPAGKPISRRVGSPEVGPRAQPLSAQASEQNADNIGQDAEIIVSARRRNELLQAVPIAVSAISGESAQRTGITNTEAIRLATPSLDFSRQIAQGATPFLRGVGSLQAAAGFESPVAIYVDDIYIGSPSGNLFTLNNIASVQVLKGPQGTLFGRNATGGVIQVQTKRPSFDPAVEATIGYGNYDTIEGSFYGTAGLTNNLAVNFAASGRKQSDGYGRNLNTGQDVQLGHDWNVRGQLLWNASEGTSLLLIGDYSKQSYDYGMNSTVVPGTVSASGATFSGYYNSLAPVLDYSKINQGGVSLRIDHEAGFAKLVSISGYRHTGLTYSFDNDGGPRRVLQAYVVTPADTYSQEFQILSNEASTLKWILGAYYLHTKTGFDPARVGGFAFGPTGPDFDTIDTQTLNSIAGFGEATYEVLPSTNVTLGARYTKDYYHLDVQGRYTSTGALQPGSTFSSRSRFPKVTYRAILDHHFSPDVMAYASYSRGFKSGGYNLSTPGTAASPAPAIRPEILDSYEIGLKTKFLNGAVTLNGSAYYYDYKDLAVNILVPTGSVVVNAGAARIKGVDLDFIIAPARGFRITGGVGVIDGEYTKFMNGPVFIPNPATCTPAPAQLPGARTGGNTQCAADLKGFTTARSPKFTMSLSPSYSFDTSVGAFTLAATYYHNSGFFWDSSNRITQPTYDVVNTSLSWDSSGKGLGVRLWARNLFDDRYLTYAASSAVRDQAAYAPPRTYGATLIVRY